MKPRDATTSPMACVAPEQRPLVYDPKDWKREGEEKGGPPPLWKAVSMMVLNVLLTVSIVIINKALFTQYDCGFAPTLLLTLHQLTCALGTQLARPTTPRSPTHRGVAGFQLLVAAVVLTRIGGNVLVNLSLKFNSVGMYQLYKMLQVPFVFAGEVLFLDVPFRPAVTLTLAALLAGVGLATVNDLSFSLIGAVCGCVAPLMAAANALLLKQMQVRHDITGNDLLRQISPWVVVLQAFVIPFTDDLTQLPGWLHTASPTAFGLVGLSCVILWGLEWSFLMVLQYTSAMSVQVLGHVKTIFIFTIGVLLFHSTLSIKGGGGIALAFAAVLAYTAVKARDTPTSPTATPAGDRRRAGALCGGAVAALLVSSVALYLLLHFNQLGS